MKRFTQSYLYPAIALLMLLMQSCIGDKALDCAPESIRIYFSYTPNTYADQGINPDDVNRVNLFAFDATGKFVAEWIDEDPQFGPDYYMTISPELGRYTFVAWLGLKDNYTLAPYPLLKKTTNIDDVILSLNRQPNGVVTTSNPLFFARINGAVVDNNTANFTFSLTQNTNKINITTLGIAPSGDAYCLKITDDNGDYKFDNSFASNAELYYTELCNKDAQLQPKGSLTIMRLAESRQHPILTLINETTGTVVYNANLIELILKLREQGQTVDFDTMHRFDIKLVYGVNMGIEVSINGWVVTENNSEI